MASAFTTRQPVTGDIRVKNNPNILYINPEDSRLSARAALIAECKALQAAGIKSGDIVYVTVAYSDGRFKPGNIRNDRRQVRYEMCQDPGGDFEMVSLMPPRDGSK